MDKGKFSGRDPLQKLIGLVDDLYADLVPIRDRDPGQPQPERHGAVGFNRAKLAERQQVQGHRVPTS
jgi:hypothetical protein